MTVGALKGIEGITPREAERSKNFFALGLMSWLYHRPTEGTLEFVDGVRESGPRSRRRTRPRSRPGYAYGETSEDFAVSYEVAPTGSPPASIARSPATQRSPTG